MIVSENLEVPLLFQDARLDALGDMSPWQAQAGEHLHKLIANPATVVLSAERGQGKTHVACAVLRAGHEHWRSRRRCTRYMTSYDFYMYLRDSVREHGMGLQAYMAEQLRPKLFALDEAQAWGETDWERDAFDRIIFRRHCMKRATILVTCMEPDLFLAALGYQARRCIDQVVRFGGFNFRRWQREQAGLGPLIQYPDGTPWYPPSEPSK